eukprot:383172-Pelagomonas_calceolata.AAC.1
MARRAVSLPRQRVGGKLMWVWWGSGSTWLQGTGVERNAFAFNGTFGTLEVCAEKVRACFSLLEYARTSRDLDKIGTKIRMPGPWLGKYTGSHSCVSSPLPQLYTVWHVSVWVGKYRKGKGYIAVPAKGGSAATIIHSLACVYLG